MSRLSKEQYAELLKDPRWQRIRLEVFQRDNFTCQVCQSTSNTLHAHHVYYLDETEGPWDYPHQAILTVCEDCHQDEHSRLPTVKARLIEEAANAGFSSARKLQTCADLLNLIAGGVRKVEQRALVIDFLNEYWGSGIVPKRGS